eukprot:m.824943 g.824943  ORF g.824943 m.824943 type:complete len:249 (-) comp59408_c0_seq28:1456-2202(-)
MPTGELIGHFANDLVALDFMGPFDATPTRHNKNILVIIDHFTRFTVAVATKDQRAETVVQALLDHWISIFGAPKRLLSDNGKCFTAGVVADILTLFEAKKIFTTSYHPQGDAVVERMNGTLQAMLSKVTNDNKDDWDLHLSSMCLAHNSSFVAAIETTPFEAMLGRQVPTLIDHLLKQGWRSRPASQPGSPAGTVQEVPATFLKPTNREGRAPSKQCGARQTWRRQIRSGQHATHQAGSGGLTEPTLR